MGDLENALPAEWECERLENVLEKIVGGGTPSKAVEGYFQGTIPLMTVKDMKIRRPSVTGFNITQEALENSSARLISADTIIIATRMGLGKVVRPKMDTAINQDLKALFPNGALDKSFLELWLMSIASVLESMGNGTTVKGVRLNEIRALEVPIAPLNEQYRIVEKIDTLFTRLDKGEEALRRLQILLKRYRQSVLKAAVTGELTADWRIENGTNKEKWREIDLGQITEYLTSGSRGWAQYYSEDGDIFIRAQNLKYDRLDLDDVAFVTLPNNSEGTRTLVKRGDILITITGANVTKSALVHEDLGRAYVSQHVALLRVVESANSEFILWFLIAKTAGRKQLEEFAYGAGKPGLNLQNIRDVRLSLPPKLEQAVIVERIQEVLVRIDVVETLCRTELTRSASLRQSILKEAFAGRLVDQDPSDEPASELLARIKGEQPIVKKTKNAKRKIKS